MGGDEITIETSLVVSREQVATTLENETVILQLESDMYYGLNQVGTEVWELLQEEKTVRYVRDRLVSTYEIEPESCENDLISFLESLDEQGLIEVKK